MASGPSSQASPDQILDQWPRVWCRPGSLSQVPSDSVALAGNSSTLEGEICVSHRPKATTRSLGTGSSKKDPEVESAVAVGVLQERGEAELQGGLVPAEGSVEVGVRVYALLVAVDVDPEEPGHVRAIR